jgi:hypothetical protein
MLVFTTKQEGTLTSCKRYIPRGIVLRGIVPRPSIIDLDRGAPELLALIKFPAEGNLEPRGREHTRAGSTSIYSPVPVSAIST